jgi:hypothetical protein
MAGVSRPGGRISAPAHSSVLAVPVDRSAECVAARAAPEVVVVDLAVLAAAPVVVAAALVVEVTTIEDASTLQDST